MLRFQIFLFQSKESSLEHQDIEALLLIEILMKVISLPSVKPFAITASSKKLMVLYFLGLIHMLFLFRLMQVLLKCWRPMESM